MRLLTWNIQCGKGCDGVTDLARIVSVAKSLADADVFCFQEVSDHFAALDRGTDQSVALAALLPDHRPIFRPAVEAVDDAGGVHRFGNMTLSRLPVLQIAGHLLPWPRISVPRSMRRIALDVTVRAAFGPVRIVNTHLEFHSAAQREVQIERLLDLQEEASTNPMTNPLAVSAVHADPYGSQILAASSILCGDFNFDVTDAHHRLLHAPQRPGLNYRDAWEICRPGQPRQPTCGVYDRAQWPEGADCRDFVFVTEDLASRVRHIEVDQATSASDHQPVLIEIAD